MKHVRTILCILLLSSLFVLPAAGAETPRPATSPVEAPVDRIEIDDAVKQATPYYVMLVGTDDEQENLLGYIDRSPRSSEEKEAMKESLQAIWRKYPVKHETETTAEGTVTRIAFAPAAGASPVLTDEENALLAEISRAMGEAFAATPTGTMTTWYDLSIWLIKTDGQGNEVWNRTYSAGDTADVASVLQTDDGGYLIAANTGFRDALLIKTDADGNEVWRKTYGGPDRDSALDMIETDDGNYVVVGSTGWTPEKDTGGTWIFKVAPDGRQIWSRTFSVEGEYLLFSTVDLAEDGGFILGGQRTSGHTETDNAWLVRVDRDGFEKWNRFIGGNASGIVDSVIWTPIDGGYLAAVRNPWEAERFGTVPIRLIKTDSSGEAVWTKTLDDAGSGTSAVLLEVPGGGAVGYLVAGGAVCPETDLPGPCLTKIGGTGNVAWTVEPETVEGSLLITSAVASSPGVYAFTGTVYAGGPHDGWLVLVDHTGNVTSAHSFGGDATDDISALAATDDGGYILAGTTRSFGENGRAAPGRAPGFGALAAMVACGLGLLCRGVRRG
ncbi:hypothetical protein [Methanoculleus sp.]|uniref:hypothetical protein n=1 Tax=Methanoculleus sp. TaxID=90427 RepID=UPI001BD1EAAA|nr:hypothetical protein [Methanoculleus sp.]